MGRGRKYEGLKECPVCNRTGNERQVCLTLVVVRDKTLHASWKIGLPPTCEETEVLEEECE